MTRATIPFSKLEATQITISTWVYVSKDAVDTQAASAKALNDPVVGKLDDHAGGQTALKRIPIMEFGNSIEPRSGVHISMGMVWEGFLGMAYWQGGVGAPSWPDYLVDYWIGGHGLTRTGWFGFGPNLVRAVNSVSYYDMWKNVDVNFGGTSVAAFCSFFYHLDTGGPLNPIPFYSNFSNGGILPYGVKNGSKLFPKASYSDARGIYAQMSSWTWQGALTAQDDDPAVSVKAGDITDSSGLLVESEIVFNNAYPDPKNNTIQKTPTNGPDGFDLIRVDTGGTGKYFAFGDLIIPFPERAGVTYSTQGNPPRTPSALYLDGGSIVFMLTGVWPERTEHADQALVPTLMFTGGSFVLDSWNHIFLTVDLTPMVFTGGNDDPLLQEWNGPFIGWLNVPVSPPDMTTPPKWAMYVNGKPVKGINTGDTLPSPDTPLNPKALLTVYPSKTGHWKTEKNFKMALAGPGGGEYGMPIVSKEIGRWKVTGPNQTTRYAYTHIYIDKYIEPTKINLSKFFWKSKNKNYNFVIPPPDKKAAVKAFGKPDIWLYRDKADTVSTNDPKGVEWKNQGTMGTLKIIGGPSSSTPKPKPPPPPMPPPFDYRPGPGQPKRKDPASTP